MTVLRLKLSLSSCNNNYADQRLNFYFFQPVLRLAARKHMDNKIIKPCGIETTPCPRILAAGICASRLNAFYRRSTKSNNDAP